MAKLRLASNNIWSCGSNQPWWEERGLDCSTEVRSLGFARAYSEFLPDVIGLQEADRHLRQTIHSHLLSGGLDYALIYGSATSIMYRADKLDLIECDFHLYPDNIPDHEGVFNNAKSKSYGIGVFRIKENGKYFAFANTHLWWMSEGQRAHSNKARTYQMSLMLDRLDELKAKYNCPAIAVGDMNTNYDSEAVSSAIARSYLHAHDIATDYADERNGWHYCFPDGYDNYEKPGPFKAGIDHILVSGMPEGAVSRFERFTPDYFMPLSDHFPVYADVEF